MAGQEASELTPYLLLDVGGTMMFPNPNVMREVILDFGADVPAEYLDLLMARYVRQLDEQLMSGAPGTFRFFEWVLERAGVGVQRIPEAASRLRDKDLESSLWNVTYPWVHQALEDLQKAGYSMSVISNADGRVEQELTKAGLRSFFEKVYDSHVVGFTKPDVRLFQHALQELGLEPEACLYVGDFYRIDVLGANQAGIAAVHLDPYGLYADCPGCRIPNVASLPSLLSAGIDLRDPLYHPLR
jgi:putative hydrolase of the HAD superfamily